MVRYFDPTESDPTLKFIRRVESFFVERHQTISESEGEKAVANFFEKDQKYKELLEEYKKTNTELPKFVFKDNCHTRSSVLSGKRDYTYYKSYYNKEENQIILCRNLFTDMLDLKENLDREFLMAYAHKIKKEPLNEDESFICSQWRACRYQYENLPELNDELKMNLSSACTKYLAKVLLSQVVGTVILN